MTTKYQKAIVALLILCIGGLIGAKIEHYRVAKKWAVLRAIWNKERQQARADVMEARLETIRTNHCTLFLGDSRIRQWETTGKTNWTTLMDGFRAINLGVDGDTRRGVLSRAVRYGYLFPELKPDGIVLLVGVNDKIEDPYADRRDGELLKQQLSKIWKDVPIVDLSEISATCEKTEDGVHLTEKGYGQLSDVFASALAAGVNRSR